MKSVEKECELSIRDLLAKINWKEISEDFIKESVRNYSDMIERLGKADWKKELNSRKIIVLRKTKKGSNILD